MIAFHREYAKGHTVGESYRAAASEMDDTRAWASFIIIGNPKSKLAA